MTRRQSIEFGIIGLILNASLKGKDVAEMVFNKCYGTIEPEMFSSQQNACIYRFMVEMKEKGLSKFGFDDIAIYIESLNRYPYEKIRNLSSYLIEIDRQFGECLEPLTGQIPRMEDLIDELLINNGYGIQ